MEWEVELIVAEISRCALWDALCAHNPGFLPRTRWTGILFPALGIVVRAEWMIGCYMRVTRRDKVCLERVIVLMRKKHVQSIIK